MTDFFLFSPQCTDKYIKTIYLIVINFSSPCFDVPKTWNFTSSGVQNRETKDRRLGMIVTSFHRSGLRDSRKTNFSAIVFSKKIRKCRRNLFSAKLEVLKWRHNHSQSPAFGLAVLYPTGSEISCFWYIKTRGRKIDIECIFCYTYQYIVEILCEACWQNRNFW